jgi:glycosyltransferase involved in cell wall biosynthesis
MAAPMNKNSESDSISVFFPCYNEQSNLRRVYESASENLKQAGINYEIILVDDGSTDQTFAVANDIAATDARETICQSHPLGLCTIF